MYLCLALSDKAYTLDILLVQSSPILLSVTDSWDVGSMAARWQEWVNTVRIRRGRTRMNKKLTELDIGMVQP